MKRAAEAALQELGVFKDLSAKQRQSVLNKVYNGAPTISIPEDIHKEGRTWGSKNKPLMQGDSTDLKGAFKKDTAAIQDAMEGKDHGCSDKYKKSVEELSKFDYDKYIVDTVKNHKDVLNLLK